MIDRERLLAMPPIVTKHSLTKRDTILYALGVGADSLDFTFEERLRALTTMAVILAYPGFFWRDPAYGADWAKILHGEQFLTLHAELPAEGEIIGETRIEQIWDKGPAKGAIALVTREIRLANGTALATARGTTMLRGDGGCGGPSEGAPTPHPIPDSAPDASVTLATNSNQALLYRLSGDLNPLHIDPAVAAGAGFPRPILHGLCTYGIVGRALVHALAGGNPARLKRLDARFSAPVFPGETIETSIWREADGRAAFRARVVERDRIVINNGLAEVA